MEIKIETDIIKVWKLFVYYNDEVVLKNDFTHPPTNEEIEREVDRAEAFIKTKWYNGNKTETDDQS